MYAWISTLYIYIYTILDYQITKANDGKKLNLCCLKFKILHLKIFTLIIYKINKYLKSVFTINAFQDFLCSIKSIEIILIGTAKIIIKENNSKSTD